MTTTRHGILYNSVPEYLSIQPIFKCFNISHILLRFVKYQHSEANNFT